MTDYQQDILKIYERSFRENWSLPALTEYGSDEIVSYGEMARRIARMHLFYKQIGLKPGDKVALLGRNSTTWVICFMATITYGATIVPILADFNAHDAQHIINHSDATVLFVNRSIWEACDFEQMPKLKVVVSLETRHVLAERPGKGEAEAERVIRNLSRRFNAVYRGGFNPENVCYPEVDKDATAIINYTSGTTGFSKGVMLTYDNICGNVVFGINSRLHYEGSRALSFLPLAHAYGCAFDMLVPLAVGTFVTLFGKTPTPRLLLAAMAQVRPNLVICVPLILEKIYRKQIVPMITRRAIRWALALPLIDGAIYANIRSKLVEAFGGAFEEVIIGGAPLNGEVEAFLHKIKFPFTVGYGMTECGPLISYTPWREFQPGSCGRTLPNMESKILSDDPETVPGEICVRGQNRMKGYYKNPSITADVIDKDGWLHTGDMGTRSTDGTLFIKGRYKTMILSASGQNIYPEEIEAKLNNMPYVNESLIVERGKGLTAIVYPDYERMDADGVEVGQLPELMERNRVELNSLVAPYEKVDYVQLIPHEFEKTPKKSIKRYLYS
ncbi:MAG: AMP-binding protein [Muribaculaceae bacterium]|jgi:long-chain acyl-CoA synthetase|nr:AMP-binding protein [Muribaculaceae bacterium]